MLIRRRVGPRSEFLRVFKSAQMMLIGRWIVVPLGSTLVPHFWKRYSVNNMLIGRWMLSLAGGSKVPFSKTNPIYI